MSDFAFTYRTDRLDPADAGLIDAPAASAAALKALKLIVEARPAVEFPFDIFVTGGGLGELHFEAERADTVNMLSEV